MPPCCLQMQPEFSVRLLDSTQGAANQAIQRISGVIQVRWAAFFCAQVANGCHVMFVHSINTRRWLSCCVCALHPYPWMFVMLWSCAPSIPVSHACGDIHRM